MFKDQAASTLEDGTDMLFRNVGIQLASYAVQHPRDAKTSAAVRRKPQTSLAFVARCCHVESLAFDSG